MPLADVIGLSIGEREFFLHEGIGWALRECSKTDPHWVIEHLARTAACPAGAKR